MDRPIGIFDSGIGGLTVAHAVRKLLPNEELLYFGDTAHLPYGDKSADSIEGYARRIAAFLTAKGCKCLIIACNSASAVAFDQLKSLYPNIPVYNVIDPVVDYVGRNFEQAQIGVIGTKRTISSGIYERKLVQRNPSLTVHALATPLLAPMIEEGFVHNNISQQVIASYLDHDNFKALDSLILGCTHYPLIKKEIYDHYRGKTKVVDSAGVVAQAVVEGLQYQGLLSSQERTPQHQFYVSDYTSSFQKSTELFFGEHIQLTETRIWE